MKLDIVRKAFDGKTVLSDLSLDFPEGRTTLLMAPSGWGKTTLLRIASGLDRDFEGEVEKGGRNVVLFQEDRLVEGISALSNLLALGKGKEECLASLFLLGLEGQERKKVSELSGGMKRRVAIARVLLMDGDRFFLDEPFTGLDGETKEAVASVLKKKLKGKTVVVVSHSEEDGPLMDSDDIIYLGEKENGRKN